MGNHMSWVDVCLQEQKTARSAEGEIKEKAAPVYTNLWEEIFDCIKIAKSGGMNIFTNGQPYERVVTLHTAQQESRNLKSRSRLKTE